MKKTTIYITIKCQVEHLEGETPDNVADRVGACANYSIEYDDDVVEIVETELIASSSSNPV